MTNPKEQRMTDTNPTTNVEIHYSDTGWAALYINGQLNTVGDADTVQEAALEALGVNAVYDDTFMMGQTKRSGIAQSIVEIENYRHTVTVRRDRAAKLEKQAKELLAEAENLRAGH